MASNMLGESILLFISVSLLGMGVVSIYQPSLNILGLGAEEEVRDGYSYGYHVSILFLRDGYLYLLNDGREIGEVSTIYVDGSPLQPPYEVYVEGQWILSSSLPKGGILRIPVAQAPGEVILLGDGYVIRARGDAYG